MSLFHREKVIMLERSMGDDLILRRKLRDTKDNIVLIVAANTEAIVTIDGGDMKIMRSGRHSIIRPKGTKIIKDLDVAFVNNEVRMQSLWGTPSHIEFIDIDTDMPAHLGASGSVVFEINNTMKIYKRLLGTGKYADVQSVISFLKNTISMNVKDIFARKLITEKISYFDIATDVKKLSADIADEIRASFDEYGVSITNFTVDNLVFPQDIIDLRKKIMAERYILKQSETSHSKLRDEAKDDAREERASAERIISSAAQVPSKQVPSKQVFCKECGVSLPVGSKFCSSCGEKV